MSTLQTIAEEITAVYPNGQFEPGQNERFAKVVGPAGTFVLSNPAEDFYVVRVEGRQMTTHHYKPESDDRVAHLHEFVAQGISSRARVGRRPASDAVGATIASAANGSVFGGLSTYDGQAG